MPVREIEVMTEARVQASRMGWRLWRNNSGCLQDARGRWVRYGLCNESKAMNKVLKSADLIGIRPVAMPDGTTIGQFVAVECKRPGGRVEPAQVKFLELVKSLGGHGVLFDGTEPLA